MGYQRGAESGDSVRAQCAAVMNSADEEARVKIRWFRAVLASTLEFALHDCLPAAR